MSHQANTVLGAPHENDRDNPDDDTGGEVQPPGFTIVPEINCQGYDHSSRYVIEKQPEQIPARVDGSPLTQGGGIQ